MKTRYQILLALCFTLAVFGISQWQQHQAYTAERQQLLRAYQSAIQTNAALVQQLTVLQDNPVSLHALTNDQIADIFERWETENTANIVALDFVSEQYDKGLDYTRVYMDATTNITGLYALFEQVLGDALFIDSLTINESDSQMVALRMQVVQPQVQ